MGEIQTPVPKCLPLTIKQTDVDPGLVTEMDEGPRLSLEMYHQMDTGRYTGITITMDI